MYFEERAKRLSPKLKGIAYKLNRRNLFFNEEDLYQEELIYLWKNSGSGTLEDKTDSYVLQGCYFHLKNYIRKHREKAPRVSLDEMLFDEENGLKREELLLVEEGIRQDYRQRLSDDLLAETIRNNGLTSKEKLILSFCADGLTTREIGRRFGVSHVSIVKSLKVIRGKCLKYLDKE